MFDSISILGTDQSSQMEENGAGLMHDTTATMEFQLTAADGDQYQPHVLEQALKADCKGKAGQEYAVEGHYHSSCGPK